MVRLPRQSPVPSTIINSMASYYAILRKKGGSPFDHPLSCWSVAPKIDLTRESQTADIHKKN